MMKEFRFINPDIESEILIVVNNIGDGMEFKYDLSNERRCYQMLIIGSPTRMETKELIEKYDNNK